MVNNVVITGASSGIGKALAYEFASRGASIGLMARRVDVLHDIAVDLQTQFPAIKVECEQLDVSDVASILPSLEAMALKLSAIDCVIANAGVSGVNRTGAGDFQKDQHIIQVNLIGGMATVDAAARYFRAHGGGQIAGISSVSAYKGIPGSAAYSASKAGFTNYLDAVRIELKKHGISVTAVHPGFVKTDIAPNMEKYPFVVSAEKAAVEIADGIEKKKASIIVPSLPWSMIRRLMPMLPDQIVEKVF